MASSRMTKGQLREALLGVGVIPESKSKMTDLVKLYKENVLHDKVCLSVQSTSAEF